MVIPFVGVDDVRFVAERVSLMHGRGLKLLEYLRGFGRGLYIKQGIHPEIRPGSKCTFLEQWAHDTATPASSPLGDVKALTGLGWLPCAGITVVFGITSHRR